jgi:hypothetical protein
MGLTAYLIILAECLVLLRIFSREAAGIPGETWPSGRRDPTTSSLAALPVNLEAARG